MSSIVNLLAIVAIAAILTLFPGVREGILATNGPLAVSVTKIFTDNSAYLFMADTVPVRWTLLIIEVLIVGMVLAALVRGILGMGMHKAWGGVRKHTTLAGSISVISIGGSVLMALYVYRVLWGSIPLLGLTEIKPADLYFADGSLLGKIGVLYFFTQVIPFISTRTTSIPWTVLDTISSFSFVAIVGFAWLSYLGGSYEWSTYRLEAMQVWGGFAMLDVVNMVVSTRLLLTRDYLGGAIPERHG